MNLFQSHKKTLLSVTVLILLTSAGVAFWFLRSRAKPVPTSRTAIGKVTTLAGSGSPGTQDGLAASAMFINPFGLAIDNRDNLIVSEGGAGNLIRRITRDGRVETIAANEFNSPSGIALDKRGNIIVADTGSNRIRKVDREGRVSTVAGTGDAGFKDGPADSAQFDGPIGVAVDETGDIIVADAYNDRLRRISVEGQVATIAGGESPGMKDGIGDSARFDTPCGVAVDKQHNIFVADTGNNAIRRVSAQGDVVTIAGGIRGRAEGSGIEAAFDHPVGILVTHDGFVFVTEEAGSRIRRITPDGLVSTVAGSAPGFKNGSGSQVHFNGPSGIAIDGKGALYVADTENYLIRKVLLVDEAEIDAARESDLLVQPVSGGQPEPAEPMTPNIDEYLRSVKANPWPLAPQNQLHEITGVMGEARGNFDGAALDHLHSGLDVRGAMGEAALSVLDERVSSPMANWGFGGSGEGIRVGLVSYIHVRIGRDKSNRLLDEKKFKPRRDDQGLMIGVRVRRGARFNVGDAVGALNGLYHVHMNYGPWNAQTNPIAFPLAEYKDTVPPVIEPNGIEVISAESGSAFKDKVGGRILINGDVQIIAAAYDQTDGNVRSRKLGLYRMGYQLLRDDGSPAPGYEQPLINMEFNRLPPDEAVSIVYAAGSGISAYGTPTRFRYIVTNRVREGEARRGVLRTSLLPAGDYIIRIIAEDYAGNRASGKNTEVRIRVSAAKP